MKSDRMNMIDRIPSRQASCKILSIVSEKRRPYRSAVQLRTDKNSVKMQHDTGRGVLVAEVELGSTARRASGLFLQRWQFRVPFAPRLIDASYQFRMPNSAGPPHCSSAAGAIWVPKRRFSSTRSCC